jgi:hypothetical protein
MTLCTILVPILPTSNDYFSDRLLAEVDDKIAAKAVVDGSGDNGIDAFYFDATERVCYLVQSKWIHNGKGSIEVGAVHKFLQGVTDLLEAKLDHFDKLKQKKPKSMLR